MLVIRLTRTGKKKQAYFRIVVQEKQKAPGSKFIEILGNYDPHSKKLEVDKEKVIEYMKKGAQPSNSLAKIFKKEGIALPAWVKINERNRAPKKKDDEDAKTPKTEGSNTQAEVETKPKGKETKDAEPVKEEKVSEDKKKEDEGANEEAKASEDEGKSDSEKKEPEKEDKQKDEESKKEDTESATDKE